MADSASPFASLAKITQSRAEELALLSLSSRYQVKGFSTNSDELQAWFDKTGKEIGESSESVKSFYSQFIIPNLPHNRMTDTPQLLTTVELGRIALKITYLECGDLRTITERVSSFLRRHPMVSKKEVLSLITHYLMPFYFEKLQHAESAAPKKQ
jgi:hypothetical protein